MTMRERAGLDRHITGNYGEDQFKTRRPDPRQQDDEPDYAGFFCADCGGECAFEPCDKVWRCRVCDTPHEADGTAIRFDEEGRQ